MKVGDYLIAKIDVDKPVWNIKWDKYGVMLSAESKEEIKIKKNNKYIISKIYISDFYELVEIYYNSNQVVGFSMTKNSTQYEYYKDIFYDFTISQRKEKLEKLAFK